MDQSAQPEAGIIDHFVAVVIVNYRTPSLTEACLRSLAGERSSFRRFQVVIVDGGSGDDSVEQLGTSIGHPEYRDWVELLPMKLNGGFGWANNQGIRCLMQRSDKPDFIHVLNPDAEVEPGAVRALAEYLSRHTAVGAVGSQLVEPDGSLTGSAFSFPTIRGEFARGVRTELFDRLLRAPPIELRRAHAAEVDWVTGASVMFRSEALRQAGLFDEGFFLYHEEIELMWRLHRAGWSVATEPLSRVRHVGGAATGVRSSARPAKLVRRTPAYWYRSRARMHALMGGRSRAALAFASWLGGHLAWRLRRGFGLAAGTKRTDHELRDQLRLGWPRAADASPAVGRIDSEVGEPPAWITRGGF